MNVPSCPFVTDLQLHVYPTVSEGKPGLSAPQFLIIPSLPYWGNPRVAQLQQKVLNQNIQLEMCNEGKKTEEEIVLKDHDFKAVKLYLRLYWHKYQKFAVSLGGNSAFCSHLLTTCKSHQQSCRLDSARHPFPQNICFTRNVRSHSKGRTNFGKNS